MNKDLKISKELSSELKTFCEFIFWSLDPLTEEILAGMVS